MAWRPALLLAVLALTFDYAGLDLKLGELFFDADAGHWYFGDSWWTNVLLHDGGRHVIQTVFLGFLLLWSASFLILRLQPLRTAAGYGVVVMLISVGLVATGKQITNMDCPWDMVPFGGPRPLVHLFGDRPDDLPRGHCFPGAHSSGGFSLMLFYFLGRLRGPRWAWAGLALGIGVGTLFASVQWLRGAHFPSHDLWSALIAWLTAWVCARWLLFKKA